jgi:hypothetical protein
LGSISFGSYRSSIGSEYSAKNLVSIQFIPPAPPLKRHRARSNGDLADQPGPEYGWAL